MGAVSSFFQIEEKKKKKRDIKGFWSRTREMAKKQTSVADQIYEKRKGWQCV